MPLYTVYQQRDTVLKLSSKIEKAREKENEKAKKRERERDRDFGVFVGESNIGGKKA